MYNTISQKNSTQKKFCAFKILVILIFSTSFSLNLLFAQDECATKKELDAKTTIATNAEKEATKALKAFDSLPKLTSKPTSTNSETAAKTTFDAANDKWILAKEAFTETKKNLKPGTDIMSIKQEIVNKQKALSEKKEELDKRDLTSYIKNGGRIAELENALTTNMNGFDRKDAEKKLENTSFKNFNPSNSTLIDKCNEEKKRRNPEVKDGDFKRECISDMGAQLLANNYITSDEVKKKHAELEVLVKATNAMIKGGSNSKKNPWDEIQRIGSELIDEIEKVRPDLSKKFQELKNLEGGIRQLQDDIQLLRTEIETLQNQLKPLTDAEKKVNEAKKEYDEADKKLKEAQKGEQAITDWEAANKKRNDLENKKNEAEKASSDAKIEKANAEKANNEFITNAKTALNNAQTLAAINTLDARLAVIDTALMTEARKEILDDPAVKEIRERLKEKMKTLKTDPEKERLRLQWRTYIERRVRPHYIRERNLAESNRLAAIRDNAVLQSFNCLTEVSTFINLLGQTMVEVMARRASLVSDMDDGAVTGADEKIPVGPIPPLDETGDEAKCGPGSYAAINPQTNKTECHCNPGLVWNSAKTACVDPQELVKAADCSAYPGSYADWNEELQKVECYCPEGKIWNSAMTACIDDPANLKCGPGSYAAVNPQTNKTECNCNPGLVWNSAKTACVDPQELVKAADCSKYPGSYADWNEELQKVECYCPEGKIWNSTMTACIDDPAMVKCGPGSYAAINPQTNQTECYCNAGLVWNSTKTACVDPQELVKAADCSGYPGSYADWNEELQKVECYCPEGKIWNTTMTACIDDPAMVKCGPGSYAALNPQTNKTECYCNAGLVWNSTKTACVDPQELVKAADCSAYPGSYAGWNSELQKVECYCPEGKTWNSTMTACVDLAGGNDNINWNGTYSDGAFTLSVAVKVPLRDPVLVSS